MISTFSRAIAYLPQPYGFQGLGVSEVVVLASQFPVPEHRDGEPARQSPGRSEMSEGV